MWIYACVWVGMGGEGEVKERIRLRKGSRCE